MAIAAACILWFAVIMYSVLGGADYGAGFWDLLAGGTRRGDRPRGLIDHAMAPVWEANNVWLIFAAIVCWTAFSQAFGSIMKTLFIPIILAGIGIVVRGSVHEGLPFVIASAVFGLSTLGALWRQFGGARVRLLAVATVVSVLLGWGVAQYPYILPTTLTIDQAAAPGSVLSWIVIAFIIAVVLVGPALLMLWMLDQRSRLDEGAEDGPAEARHRVVIIGGGFGGLFATKALAMAPVDVTLLDRHNYHLFQPLLYQVSTGILSEGQIGPPLRDVTRNARNCRVELAEVTGFDLDERVVSALDPIGRRMEIPYDSLIVAAGGRPSYFAHDQFGPVAPGTKSIRDPLEP